MSVAVVSIAIRFPSLHSSVLFPGRATLYIFEVSRVLRMSDQHIINLTEHGDLGYIDTGKSTNKSPREFRRIPVCAFDTYVQQGGRPTVAGYPPQADPGTNGVNGHSKNGVEAAVLSRNGKRRAA